MIQIRLKLASSFFRDYQRKLDDGRMEVKKGSSVQDIVEELDLPRKMVGVITVNGKQGSIDTILSDGDDVCIFARAIAGG
jgi:sulfur carrier protein ThiS